MLDFLNVQLQLTNRSEDSEEILKNVEMILTTSQGSVPYDREFGIDGDIVDQPIEEAKSLYVVEAITKVRKYEPRVFVDQVKFVTNHKEGKVYPKVVLAF